MIEYSFVFSSYVGTRADLAEHLRGEARDQTKAYPQYGGSYFDGWKLGRLARTVRTKAGLAGEKGDLVLFREDFDGRTFWSRRNAIATGCARTTDVKEVAA